MLSFLGACAALSATSCVHPYEMPKPNEPHAVLKVRRVYEKTAGVTLGERVFVNGALALDTQAASAVASSPRASGLLVHPLPAKIEVRGAFWHQEMRTVQEPYTEQESYMDTESYSCGFGTNYQTCTRTVTRYRSVTKYRWVTKMVDVGDGSCARLAWLSPQVGHVYLIDFTYREADVCSAVCVEQTSFAEDGTFTSAPCPVPTPREVKDLTDS